MQGLAGSKLGSWSSCAGGIARAHLAQAALPVRVRHGGGRPATLQPPNPASSTLSSSKLRIPKPYPGHCAKEDPIESLSADGEVQTSGFQVPQCAWRGNGFCFFSGGGGSGFGFGDRAGFRDLGAKGLGLRAELVCCS